ncbi:MAG: HAMP domain-containing protein [bacterium]
MGAGTLLAIERTLAEDLTTSLDSRMTKQAHEVAAWLSFAGHPDRLAPRLASVTGARITIVGADGLVQGDSLEPATVGQPVGALWEVSQARLGEVGHAIRNLTDDGPLQYVVAVPADLNRVVRLAVPLDDVLETRARMRNRLLVGAGFGLIGCLVLSWIFIRALTRPLQAMTHAAEKVARGDHQVPLPIDSGGELGVLARAMNRMSGEVQARVGELTDQRDLLSVVVGGLVEGVVVVRRDRSVALVNDAARPLIASLGSAGARSTPGGSAESIASLGSAGARSTPGGSAESIDEMAADAENKEQG